jgi:hypothetical protein
MDHIPAMENLSPHKKFEGPPTIKPIFRPFYIHKWPKDLPSECKNCGSKFYVGMNLEIGRNRFFRFLKKAWLWAVIPCTFAPFLLPALFPKFMEMLSSGYSDTLLIIIFLTPGIMCFLSIIGPITRRVICLKCDWSQDFPSLKAIRKIREQESISET